MTLTVKLLLALLAAIVVIVGGELYIKRYRVSGPALVIAGVVILVFAMTGGA